MIHYGDRHIDVGLTNFSKRLGNGDFIWPQLLPRFGVSKMSDKYWVYGEEHFKVPEVKRADKSESHELEFTMSSSSFDCEPSAAHVKISQRDREMADSGIQIEMDAVEFAKNGVNLGIEAEVAAILTSTSNITHYHALDGSALGYGQWDDFTGGFSDPIKSLNIAKQAIFTYALVKANLVVIPYAVWLKVKDHPRFENILKYSEGRMLIEGEWVPTTIDGMRALYPMGAYDSTKKGQTRVSFTSLWGDNVLVAHVAPRIGWGVNTLGVSFDYKGPVVRKWHDNDGNYDKVEFEEQGLDHVLVNANCGYLLTDITA